MPGVSSHTFRNILVSSQTQRFISFFPINWRWFDTECCPFYPVRSGGKNKFHNGVISSNLCARAGSLLQFSEEWRKSQLWILPICLPRERLYGVLRLWGAIRNALKEARKSSPTFLTRTLGLVKSYHHYNNHNKGRTHQGSNKLWLRGSLHFVTIVTSLISKDHLAQCFMLIDINTPQGCDLCRKITPPEKLYNFLLQVFIVSFSVFFQIWFFKNLNSTIWLF